MNEEELIHRIKNAIILLKEGHPLNVGELTFGSKDNNHFSISGWSIKNNLEDITRDSVLKELNEIKELFSKMVRVSTELSDFIKGKQIEYYLGYDYGMGSIGICKEINGQIKWEIDLK
jgi:hypothetical protein